MKIVELRKINLDGSKHCFENNWYNKMYGVRHLNLPLITLNMVTIYRKEGWILNPNDKIVNSIFKMIENNAGKCPCYNDCADTTCPCESYRINDKCHCGLYLK